MLQLLKIEWMKMKRYNAFILISIFFIIGLFGSNYIVYAFKKHVVDGSDPTGIIASRSIFSFPTVWQTVSYFGGITLILPALLLLILVTNEYAFRTNRQNIIDGISRQSFIQVKLMLTLIIAVISTAITVLVAILFGKLVGGDFSFYLLTPCPSLMTRCRYIHPAMSIISSFGLTLFPVPKQRRLNLTILLHILICPIFESQHSSSL